MSNSNPDDVVSVLVTLDPGSGLPVCTPNPVVVTAPDTLIVFRLDAANHQFPSADAVVVSEPGDDFPYPCWRTDRHTVALYDAADDNLSFRYTVTVINTSTGEPVRVDPGISNQSLGHDRAAKPT